MQLIQSEKKTVSVLEKKECVKKSFSLNQELKQIEMCHLPDEEEVVILLYLKEVSQGWKSLSTNMYIRMVLIFVYFSPYLPDLDNGKLAELDSGCF